MSDLKDRIKARNAARRRGAASRVTIPTPQNIPGETSIGIERRMADFERFRDAALVGGASLIGGMLFPPIRGIRPLQPLLRKLPGPIQTTLQTFDPVQITGNVGITKFLQSAGLIPDDPQVIKTQLGLDIGIRGIGAGFLAAYQRMLSRTAAYNQYQRSISEALARDHASGSRDLLEQRLTHATGRARKGAQRQLDQLQVEAEQSRLAFQQGTAARQQELTQRAAQQRAGITQEAAERRGAIQRQSGAQREQFAEITREGARAREVLGRAPAQRISDMERRLLDAGGGLLKEKVDIANTAINNLERVTQERIRVATNRYLKEQAPQLVDDYLLASRGGTKEQIGNAIDAAYQQIEDFADQVIPRGPMDAVRRELMDKINLIQQEFPELIKASGLRQLVGRLPAEEAADVIDNELAFLLNITPEAEAVRPQTFAEVRAIQSLLGKLIRGAGKSDSPHAASLEGAARKLYASTWDALEDAAKSGSLSPNALVKLQETNLLNRLNETINRLDEIRDTVAFKIDPETGTDILFDGPGFIRTIQKDKFLKESINKLGLTPGLRSTVRVIQMAVRRGEKARRAKIERVGLTTVPRDIRTIRARRETERLGIEQSLRERQQRLIQETQRGREAIRSQEAEIREQIAGRTREQQLLLGSETRASAAELGAEARARGVELQAAARETRREAGRRSRERLARIKDIGQQQRRSIDDELISSLRRISETKQDPMGFMNAFTLATASGSGLAAAGMPEAGGMTALTILGLKGLSHWLLSTQGQKHIKRIFARAPTVQEGLVQLGIAMRNTQLAINMPRQEDLPPPVSVR